MSRAFRKLHTDNRELNQVQENIEQTFRQVLRSEILDGQLFKDVILTSGTDYLLEHKLGRAPVGYLVVRQNANAVIYDEKSDDVAKRNFIILKTSANVTADIWVF